MVFSPPSIGVLTQEDAKTFGSDFTSTAVPTGRRLPSPAQERTEEVEVREESYTDEATQRQGGGVVEDETHKV